MTLLCIAFISFEGCKKDPDGEKPEVKAPDQIVGVEEAREMYNTYTDRRARLIQMYEDSLDGRDREYDQKQQQMQQDQAEVKKDSFDVARYGYYDYKTLKQYLDYIEQQAARANVEIATLRIYFSNYGDKETFEDGKPVVHPRQNSFILVPSTLQDKQDYAFYLRELSQDEVVPVLLNKKLEEIDPQGMGNTESGQQRAYASMIPYEFNSAAAPFQGNLSTFMNESQMVPPPH
ncbi:hypothetical protein GTQ38_03765 [Flavobacteriaceae bacterium R33]|uniref:Uncharacterized protein n=2 Tax=Poritiphilus flavus TaxID=2697053 RepID=A0A6L9E929_9FLAO|nr:hypothetical protein [Poritiphilus flavus]